MEINEQKINIKGPVGNLEAQLIKSNSNQSKKIAIIVYHTSMTKDMLEVLGKRLKH